MRVLDNAALDVAAFLIGGIWAKCKASESDAFPFGKTVSHFFEEYQRVRAIQNFNEQDFPIPTQGRRKSSDFMDF